jgi:hypothetical protein
MRRLLPALKTTRSRIEALAGRHGAIEQAHDVAFARRIAQHRFGATPAPTIVCTIRSILAEVRPATRT